MPRLLSLFDGTGAISRPFIEGGWEVQSLDIDGSHGATLTIDIMLWDYLREPPCDCVFAGCPCEAYSIANTRGKRNLTLADSLVSRTLEIIQHFQQLNPELLFFVENPDSSLLWRRKVAESFVHYVRLDFCQYGKPYRKRTRLATNALGYVPRPLCDPKTCRACLAGKHLKTAQRGPSRSRGVLPIDDDCTLDALHAYPAERCREIFAYCRRRQWFLV